MTAAVEDFLSAGADEEEPKVRRDSYGRYLLHHPHSTNQKEESWTRTTTLAKSISDTFALGQWQQRMAVKGIAMREDLVALASTLDVSRDAKKLNAIVEEAKNSAGQKRSANLGTALHSFSESVDGGVDFETIPAPHRWDIAAYLESVKGAGLKVIPGMIERITCVPQYKVAGTFDRVFQLPSGERVLADLKTGKDLSFGWLEIAVQLFIYARGVNEVGVWNLKDRVWEKAEPVREDYGIVMHVPAGRKECTLYRVDLEAGRQATELCAQVRDWRKRRDLASVYKPENHLDAWRASFSAVTSREDASELYQKALKDPRVSKDELTELIALGKEALSHAA